MIGVTELRKGVVFELDGELYRVLQYDHHKIGRGGASVRTRIRNVRTGTTLDRTFNASDRVQDARLDHQSVQYLYRDGDLYTFMDLETFEQPVLSAEHLTDVIPYLKEEMTVALLSHDNQPIEVELPTTVDLKVMEAEMAVAGDTATGATKQVITETGLKVVVPLFVKEGETIRVDTRNGKYLTRL